MIPVQLRSLRFGNDDRISSDSNNGICAGLIKRQIVVGDAKCSFSKFRAGERSSCSGGGIADDMGTWSPPVARPLLTTDA